MARRRIIALTSSVGGGLAIAVVGAPVSTAQSSRPLLLTPGQIAYRISDRYFAASGDSDASDFDLLVLRAAPHFFQRQGERTAHDVAYQYVRSETLADATFSVTTCGGRRSRTNLRKSPAWLVGHLRRLELGPGLTALGSDVASRSGIATARHGAAFEIDERFQPSFDPGGYPAHLPQSSTATIHYRRKLVPDHRTLRALTITQNGSRLTARIRWFSH